MSVPSSNLIVLILLLSRMVLALLIGFPYPQSTLLASHLGAFSSSPVHLLKRCSFVICVSRFSWVPVVILISSANSWSSYVMYALVGVRDWCVGL